MQQKQLLPGRVTVGIPTRNRAELVLRAIRTALSQTHHDIEVVVSDNASSDDTAARVREIEDPRLTFIQQIDDVGMTGNFNACLHAATGELLLLCSDDDLLEPTAIEKLSRPFFQTTHGTAPDNVGVTWCPCQLIDPEGNPLWVTEAGPAVESPVSFLTSLYTGTRGLRYCGAMFRTADAIAAGGMNEARHGVLFDTGNLGLIALRYPAVICIDEPLARYSMHAQSATSEAECAQWQAWGSNMLSDHVSAARILGCQPDARKLASCRSQLLANLTTDVLLRGRDRPGFLSRALREVWRSRRFMFTPYVFRRAMVDGMKLLRAK